MRKEPFTVGDFVHLIRRGGRGLPIVRDESDKWRYIKINYYLNDVNSDSNTMRDVEIMLGLNRIKIFERPSIWPKRERLLSLLAFTLNNNHDHIIALEIREKGISKFMQRSGISMSKHHNEKYGERGSLFQGAYKAKRIDSDEYLRWVAPYVMVKNTFEMHPRGYEWTTQNFEDAWKWAIQYPFSSLGDYAGVRNSPIVDTAELKKLLGSPKEFKELCRDMILGRRKPDAETIESNLFFEEV
jgi:hypothetical protein